MKAKIMTKIILTSIIFITTAAFAGEQGQFDNQPPIAVQHQTVNNHYTYNYDQKKVLMRQSAEVNETDPLLEKITKTIAYGSFEALANTPQIALQTVVQLVTQEATVAAIKKLKQLLDPTSADQKKLAFQLKSSEKELQLLTTSIEIISQKIALNNKMLKRYPTNVKIQEIVAKDNERLENNLVKLLQASTAKLLKHSDTMVEIASYNLEKSAVETAITAALAQQEPLAAQKQESKDQ